MKARKLHFTPEQRANAARLVPFLAKCKARLLTLAAGPHGWAWWAAALQDGCIFDSESLHDAPPSALFRSVGCFDDLEKAQVAARADYERLEAAARRLVASPEAGQWRQRFADWMMEMPRV